VHFGATFFPDCATTVDDLLRRAEVALRIAASNTTRYQLDSAEAPEMPPAESLRRANLEVNAMPAAEMAPPPVLTNPVAAALVDEAYAERAREATTEARPDLRVVASRDGEPGTATDQAKTLGISGPVPSLQVAAPAEAAVVVEPVAGPREPAEVAPASEQPAYVRPYEVIAPVTMAPLDADLPPDFVYEPVAASVQQAEEAPVGEMVEGPMPELVGARDRVATAQPESVAQPLAEPVQAASEVADDFEALLKQMDETLKMIRSVRSSAA
jgi:hypothetical protein